MCIPLCGDPVHLTNLWEVDYSASHLAASLEEVLTGARQEDLPCLAGVPAYVSPRILESPAFQEFLHSIPGYEAIFQQGRSAGPALIESVDTVISGVGIIASESAKEHETAAFIRERAYQEKVSLKELRTLLLGDIGGLLVERPDLDARGRARVKDLNRGWIGMTFQHLERVSKGAKANSTPGVIAIAHGLTKAPMVAEILRRGYVNQLIIDTSIGEALNEILSRVDFHRRR